MNNQELLAKDKAYVMGTYARAPMVLVRGQGARVWDADGKEYLDFLGGIAVNVLGHCHPNVVEAIQRQAGELIHVSNLYGSQPQVEAAELLTQHSFADKVFFCNSGAEANEGAIKLARKWARAAGGPEGKGGDRYEIITVEHAFHGRTLATLAATGKYMEGFTPLPGGFVKVAWGDLASIEAALNDHTAAILVEPIQGEGGINVAAVEYLKGLRALCDRHGLALMFDEIQCGMGRTGALWAHELAGVRPDIMTLAKGLGSGIPIGAFLATDRVAQYLVPGTHGSTFGGNPVATAAAVATLKVLLGENVMANAARVGEYFKRRLEGLRGKYPFFAEVRGPGLMIGVELTVPGKDIVESCRQAGLILNCTEVKVLRFLPPLNITVADVDQAVEILDRVLSQVQVAAA